MALPPNVRSGWKTMCSSACGPCARRVNSSISSCWIRRSSLRPCNTSSVRRAYKDINPLAFQLLRPGGLLATFSCSGAISLSLFQSIVAGAAQDAGVDVELLEQLRAAEDHPVVLAFPEGEYLKGPLVRRR